MFSRGAGLILDVVGDFGDLVHQEFVGAVGDIQQNEVGSGDVVVVEERRLEGLRYGGHGPAVSTGGTGAHDGGTGIAHDRLDVVHVVVDVSGEGDDLGNAFRCGAQHFIRVGEGLL